MICNNCSATMQKEGEWMRCYGCGNSVHVGDQYVPGSAGLPVVPLMLGSRRLL